MYCGTLFFTIDPNREHVWVTEELDIRQGDAQRWAEEVKSRQGDLKFHSFVIDQQMGREHPPGAGKNVAQQYWDALVEVDCLPQENGPLHGFFPGSKDTEARQESLVSWLGIRSVGPHAGTPYLRVFRGQCPQLERQVRNAHTDPNRPNKRMKVRRRPEDLVTCLEYGAAYVPYYFEPVPIVTAPTVKPMTVVERLHAKQERMRQVAYMEMYQSERW